MDNSKTKAIRKETFIYFSYISNSFNDVFKPSHCRFDSNKIQHGSSTYVH